jgi:hypothetical protein
MKIKDETLGMWLGVLGVACFAVTLPMTRLATGTQDAPQLSPWFVTLGRAALAGVLSAIFLLVTRPPLPQRHQWKPLGMAVLGNAIGYPLLLAYALRVVSASHAAVVTALLPLVTAACAAWVLHQRARLGFWLCALAGSALVIVFSVLRAGDQSGSFGFAWGDLLLVGAVFAASRAGHACSGGRARDLLGLRDGVARHAAGHAVAVARAAGGDLGLGRLRLCRRVLDVDGLLRLVPRSRDGRRAAREPDPIAATLSLDPRRGTAARRADRHRHPRLRGGGGGHRGGRQEALATAHARRARSGIPITTRTFKETT